MANKIYQTNKKSWLPSVTQNICVKVNSVFKTLRIYLTLILFINIPNKFLTSA
jgi:hypothetical protein